ncbi:hypothetical protein HZS_5032 [Henneguya salminicola]|nr:hypothetical protein HZS_5032 [Henneguya salminicola]
MKQEEKIKINSPPKKTFKPETAQNQKYDQSFGKRKTSDTSYTAGVIIVPIKALTPYQSKWTIRARVIGKANIRTYQNSKGEGKLFSVTFVDESVKKGEIRATAFNEAVDLFYDLLEPKKIFFISAGTLKIANKQFSSCQNEYEMTLNSDSVIKPCFDEVNLPLQKYNFIDISKISQSLKDSLIDLIAVIIEVGPSALINSKAGARQLCKRELTISDESLISISLTLWGEDADSEKFTDVGTVLAIKAAKVSEFHGRTLSTISSTVMEKNPDVPQTRKLDEWYRNLPSDTKFTPISDSFPSSTFGNSESSLKVLHEISSMQNICMDKGEIIQVVAMLEQLRADNIIYKACPTPNCNKKLSEEGSNSYRCEKCNRSFNTYSPRLLCNAKIVDATSIQWVTFFNETIEKITASNAKEIDSASQNDRNILDEILNRPKFKRFSFKLKLKLDTFNDETRIRCTCIDARPDIDYCLIKFKLIK